MTAPRTPTMRDALIEAIHARMGRDEAVFFLSADLGAPALDAVRADFPDRFVNVGIAEQNLINVAAGLAMEGMAVFTYAIAPFYLRALEQVRNNLALAAQLRPMDVTMVGLGAGISYDVSGPTHHCLEDIGVFRSLPNVEVISPGDWVSARAVAAPRAEPRPRYVRLDGKTWPALRAADAALDWDAGFSVVRPGTEIAVVATGVMVHRAIEAAARLPGGAVAVIDLFAFDRDLEALAAALAGFGAVVTVEEAFIGRGGLDAMVASVLCRRGTAVRLRRLGMGDGFEFRPGTRYALHDRHGFGLDALAAELRSLLEGPPAR